MPGRPAALLDRDGVVIHDRHYLSHPDQVELLPGAADGLRSLSALGLALVLVTNQSGVARGYFSTDSVAAVHARLAELLQAEGLALDGVYFCPHGPHDGCDCRKPRPGLAEQAARDLVLDLSRSFVIGDKCCDVALGRAVGACSILVRTGYGAEHEKTCGETAHAVADDLDAAARVVAARMRQGA
ncbi:MAG: D-glycero-alpha-D-manno-heptose-1,7-bisphosphate 7-phosphatase [Desulfovibrionaceae bacterium]